MTHIYRNTLKNDKVAKLRLSNEDLIVYYKKFTNRFELANKVLNDKEIIKLASTDCGLARSSVNIDSYGNVFPCGNVRIAAGNISETDLSEIWTNSSLFSEFRSRINSPRKKCSNCDMRTLCNQ
ncbi:MAG: SPASM domain-containing protein [Endomicrobium sp.]|jgi:radical SAM protein with 4Fe4S-binding SPASM domain|nr:SPASM domain-containing protein [Endomicrobium sp.]